MTGSGARGPDEPLNHAVVRVMGPGGALGGAGFLVAPDLVVTCAHVVTDALERPRDHPVVNGTSVLVDLPLAGDPAGCVEHTADVEHWVPIRPDRTGDLAVLRLREAPRGARPLSMADPESVWKHGACAVGFTGGEPGETWFRGTFGGATSEGWVQLSRSDGQAPRVGRGFSGSPVWDTELGAVVGLVVAAQSERDAQQAYVLRTRTLLREIPELRKVVLPPSPFLGLSPFQEAHADRFFGRDRDIEDVITALSGPHPAVVLCGPSGCGKSSLALAGVVPRMRQAGYDVALVNAGQISSPRSALATDIYETLVPGRPGDQRVRSAAEVETLLEEKGLADTLHRVRGRASGKLLVVLDQAEALLSSAHHRGLPDHPEDRAKEASDLLFPAAGELSGTGVLVLVTLRADLLDAVLKHPHLGPSLARGEMRTLAPMRRDQLHEVITRPVDRVPAVGYETGLAEHILEDAGADPGALPLLSFVLEQLWERRAGGVLSFAAYEEMGRVPGALARHTRNAWRECVTTRDEAEALRLLTRLVRVPLGSGTPLRRRVTREEAGDQGWELARAFADRRILTLREKGAEGEPETAELSHEALVTTWTELRERVAADGEFLAGRAELEQERQRWERADRSADLLPAERRLLTLGDRLGGRENELAPAEREFLHRARRRQRAKRVRTRAAWLAMAVVFALLAGLGTLLAYESRVSSERAAEGLSRSLAVLSEDLEESNAGQAALAALAAYEVSPTQEARSALLRRYDGLRTASWALTGTQGPVDAAAMSADGAVTLVISRGGRATLFVRTAGGRVRQQHLPLGPNVMSPVVSRDGSRIAYLREASGVVVWHEVTPSAKHLLGPARPLSGGRIEEFPVSVQLGDTKIMDFSPDAGRLVGLARASETVKGRVLLWDLDTGRARRLPERLSDLSEVWFGPDENTLVAQRTTGGSDSSMVAVDIRTAKTRVLADDVDMTGTGVSGDGRVLIACRNGTGTERGGHRAVRIADGQVLSRFSRGEGRSCTDIAVEEKGRQYVVEGGLAGEWMAVDTRGDRRTRLFSGPTDFAEIADLPLLGTLREPVLVDREGSAVTGWALNGTSGTVFGRPVLLGDGSTMLARMGEEGDRLRISETTGGQKVLSEVRTAAAPSKDAWQGPAVNAAQTLMADRTGLTRITVRELPSLDRTAEVTTVEPPPGPDEQPDPPHILFLGGDELVTLTGSRIEHWNARSGHRLSPTIDLRDLRLTTKNTLDYSLGRHPEPGHVLVTVAGEPDVHAIDLRAGREARELRVRLGDDLVTAEYLDDPRYMAALTTGLMVELWSVPPGRPPQREVGPLGPLGPRVWKVNAPGGSRFLVANRSSVRFLKAADPAYGESYEFGEDQEFLTATRDGSALLRPAAGGSVDLIRLDPEIWKRHLCGVLDRELTAEERDGLPPGLPKDICS